MRKFDLTVDFSDVATIEAELLRALDGAQSPVYGVVVREDAEDFGELYTADEEWKDLQGADWYATAVTVRGLAAQLNHEFG